MKQGELCSEERTLWEPLSHPIADAAPAAEGRQHSAAQGRRVKSNKEG
jgi:hypothetical protein